MRVPCDMQIESLATALVNEREASRWAIQMQAEHIARIEAELDAEIGARAAAERRAAALQDVVDALRPPAAPSPPLPPPSAPVVTHGGPRCTKPSLAKVYPSPGHTI
jgi:MoxR-like ATPase